MLNHRPAKGTKGFIIRTFDKRGNDSYAFRVYDKGHIHKFTDYDILHYDMEVEILDDDATFYEYDMGAVIDHAPYKEN
jgi:hypothetical protein